MKRSQLLLGVWILVLFSSNAILAASAHQVNLSIHSYARISVTGSAAVYITSDDFFDRIKEKNLTSNVAVTVKSNCGFNLLISGKDFAGGFPIHFLQARLNRTGENFQALSTTGITLSRFIAAENNRSYNVSFKLTDIQQLDLLDLDSYSTVINYTAVVAP